MSADDYNNGQSGQNQQFNDAAHQQGQGQTQGGLPGANQPPSNANNDTGGEGSNGREVHVQDATTTADNGTVTKAPAGTEDPDNAGTDNFAPRDKNDVEDVDSDQSVEPAGGAEPSKSDIDLDEEDEDEADDDEADIQGA